jgi:hypothetical protein
LLLPETSQSPSPGCTNIWEHLPLHYDASFLEAEMYSYSLLQILKFWGVPRRRCRSSLARAPLREVTGKGHRLKYDHIMMKAANQFGASLENENERRIMKKKRDWLILDTLLCSYSRSTGSGHGEIQSFAYERHGIDGLSAPCGHSSLS